jgi:hypothetical protein
LQYFISNLSPWQPRFRHEMSRIECDTPTMSSNDEQESSSVESFSAGADLPAAPAKDWQAIEDRQRKRSLAIAAVLFLLTLVSTLAVGAGFATSYAEGRMPRIEDILLTYSSLLANPRLLLLGLPYATTLMGILLAHELGHYFACRYYGISASYPYFIPAPTLIGTMGAFIRIRSPIYHRKALFDVGLAGPVVGFLFAIPALAIAIIYSRPVPLSETNGALAFGNPLALRLLLAILRPGASPGDLLLHPVGRAAWAGLFATALNLLPGGQLDGGHILYALASSYHRRVTLAVAVLLVPVGYLFWPGWYLWAGLLLAIGFRHPPLLYQWERLDHARLVWAGIAVLIFILSFIPVPVR